MEARTSTGEEVTVRELDRRALTAVVRVRDGRSISPLIGVPMGAGMKPFVTRREWIEGQSKGLETLRVRFDFSGERAVMVIAGEFGRDEDNKGSGRYRGKHTAKLPNLSEVSGRAGIGLGVRWDLREWAEKSRGKHAKAVAEAAMDAEELASSKKRVRLEGKVKRLDEGIRKLKRKIEKLYVHRPVNPLIGRRETWDVLMEQYENDVDYGRVSKYERERALQYALERAHQKLISNLAAKYLSLKVVKPNTLHYARSRRRRGYGLPRAEFTVMFPWKKFYAELAEYGIKPVYEYSKCHAWKDGPESPESYLRNMYWFGLAQSRDRYSGNYRRKPTFRKSRTEAAETDAEVLKPKTDRELEAEMMKAHADARMEYLGVRGELRMLESMIEGLEAERTGVVEEIENLNKRGE